MIVKKQIEFYIDENGRCPFNEWFISLKDKKTMAVIANRLDRVKLGNLGHYRSIGNGSIELKINYGSGFRIYAGLKGSALIILLCAGDKSTQSKDIKKAHEYWADFRR